MQFPWVRLLMLLALFGAALFYFTDDPFDPLFLLGLGFVATGAISAGLLLAYRLIRAGRFWAKIVGYGGGSLLLVVVFAFVVVLPNYRAFFYHQLRPEEWRADLNYLVDRIRQVHPNPFSTHSREELESLVRDLDERIPILTDSENEMGFARIVALVGDGHSDLIPFQPATGFNMYPLQLYEFSDGLYVTAAAPRYRDLVGWRLAVGKDL